MKLQITLALACFSLIAKAQSYQYPFQNPNLPVEVRSADLVKRLTLEEKVAQMLNKTPAIDRLGIPAYNWWNECLHGVARTEYKVTVYPQAIAMAAGWDTDAMKLMGDYTGDEGRAIYNTSSAKGDRSIYHGLTYWTPNINIFRDPRWGRGQETYGEDPYLTGTLGRNFVSGLQGDDPVYLKAAACAKHFAVHSGPESSRHSFNTEVSTYDLWDTYLPAFKNLVVDAKVAGVMCAYNAYATQPCCSNDLLMTDILRNQWKFTGYVTSDCGAIDDFFNFHKTHPDAKSAAIDAVFHGTDVECGNQTYKALVVAVQGGGIKEELIDRSVQRLFNIRFRLGLLNDAAHDKYSKIGMEALEAPAHQQLALKMAHQSMVLLKNENNLLPLSKSLHKVAVLGPNADNAQTALGNYNGTPSKNPTALAAIKAKLGTGVEVYYDKGIDYTKTINGVAVADVAEKVKDADAIIFVGGISPRLEGEEMKVSEPGFKGGDRTTIALPTIQTELMKALKATGKPVVFVMMTGSAIGVEWENDNIPAILNAWYGGQAAGVAVADILFGDYNPSGRLPVTFYKNDKDLPPFDDYSMNNRTYRYFTGKPLYPFGYGLSYTAFSYSFKTAPAKSITANGEIKCAVNITNTGKLDGDEVVQAYIQYPQNGGRKPLKELKQFKRVTVQHGGSNQVVISIPASALKKWDAKANRLKIIPGKYSLVIGGSSEDKKLVSSFTVM